MDVGAHSYASTERKGVESGRVFKGSSKGLRRRFFEVKIRQRIVAAEQITAVLGALQRLPQVGLG